MCVCMCVCARVYVPLMTDLFPVDDVLETAEQKYALALRLSDRFHDPYLTLVPFVPLHKYVVLGL